MDTPKTTPQFAEQVFEDLAAAYAGAMTTIGHRLGLFRSLAHDGPATAEQLAERTGCHPRYVREWLGCQRAGGYVRFEPGPDLYALPDSYAPVLAQADSPMHLAPAFDAVTAAYLAVDRLTRAFRSGDGIGWHEHDHGLFHATEALFKPGYRESLATTWIGALEGVTDKLERGGLVADVGCGHGASTIVMAEAFPRSTFFGFDYHVESIVTARARAAEAGVEDRVHFQVVSAEAIPRRGYDLVCMMDSFHDFGDPVGIARAMREALAEDGTLLLVEPFAHDRDQDNTGTIARLFYAASTAFCTPNARSQGGEGLLGAQAGARRTAELLGEAGFSSVTTATQTPLNLVLEARP